MGCDTLGGRKDPAAPLSLQSVITVGGCIFCAKRELLHGDKLFAVWVIFVSYFCLLGIVQLFVRKRIYSKLGTYSLSHLECFHQRLIDLLSLLVLILFLPASQWDAMKAESTLLLRIFC